MKMNNTHMKIALGFALMTGFAQAGTWQGGTGNWTDNNWGTGGYPGDTADDSAVAIGSGEVTLNTNIPFSVGDGFTAAFNVNNAILNIGANITSAAHTTFGGFNGSTTTVNHSDGTFTQGFRLNLGNQGATGTLAYNLSGGTFDMNNNDFRLGYNTSGSMAMNVSGTGNLEFGNMALYQGDVNISGGTVTSTGTINMNAAGGTASTIAIDGSNASTVSFTTLSAFNTGGSATLQFIADGSGIKAMDVTTLNLNTDSDISILDLDFTNWDGTSGLVNNHLILADYTTLNGTFSSINMTGGNYSVVYDYDMGGGDLAIAVVIPEPSTLVLFGIAGLSLMMGLRRRTRSGNRK